MRAVTDSESLTPSLRRWRRCICCVHSPHSGITLTHCSDTCSLTRDDITLLSSRPDTALTTHKRVPCYSYSQHIPIELGRVEPYNKLHNQCSKLDSFSLELQRIDDSGDTNRLRNLSTHQLGEDRRNERLSYAREYERPALKV